MTLVLRDTYNALALGADPPAGAGQGRLSAEKHMPTVAIETHGCKLNQADSARLASQWEQAGYRLVAEGEPADVYLVNTCTVTHIADRKARQALRAARRRHPHATVVATGCYAERVPQGLRRMPEVDLVAGNVDKPGLVGRVLRWRDDGPFASAPGVDTGGPGDGAVRTRAMVKIQEGCDQVCAYCVVPRVRGRETSVPPQEIVSRVNSLVARGHNEVVLTGTQLGSYGFDLPGTSLKKLLKRLLREGEMSRLRVSSLQPQEIESELLALWSDRRLCPHFHLPLQSGSDDVLRLMRRRYTAHRYLQAAEAVRRAVPGASITADVLVGFPGETDADFAETLSLCREAAFAGIHVFPYSPRPGTSAARYPRAVDPVVKSRRAKEVASLARRQAAAFRDGLLGTTRPVLWEGRKKDHGPEAWVGLTDNYVRVVGASREPLAGRITPARLLRREEDLVFAGVM